MASTNPSTENGTADADGVSEEIAATHREETRGYWKLAAILFAGGGIGAVVPDILHQPSHPVWVYLLPWLAVASGAVCWFIAPFARRRWLHLVAITATIEIAVTVAFADQIFSIYYTFIAIFVAYMFSDRRAIAAHIGFAALVSFAPLIYDPDGARESLIRALVLAPTLILAGGAVAYLRERLEASEDRYRNLSERDPLTGVGNYRMLSVRVPKELGRHRRYRRPLALMVIDLDDFKRINDSYGHQRGDYVLQEVGLALLAGVREHDIVVRQGGDEFAVVAPETDRNSADQLAKRLVSSITKISAGGVTLGASMAYARFPDDADSLEGLLGVADARLRDAKSRKPFRYARSASTDGVAGDSGSGAAGAEGEPDGVTDRAEAPR